MLKIRFHFIYFSKVKGLWRLRGTQSYCTNIFFSSEVFEELFPDRMWLWDTLKRSLNFDDSPYMGLKHHYDGSSDN